MFMRKYFTVDYIFLYVFCILYFLAVRYFYFSNIHLYFLVLQAILMAVTSGSYREDRSESISSAFWQPFSICLSMAIAAVGASVFFVLSQVLRVSAALFYLIIGSAISIVLFHILVRSLFKLTKGVGQKNALRLFYKYTLVLLFALYVLLNIAGFVVLWRKDGFLYSVLDEIVFYIGYLICNLFVYIQIEKLLNVHTGVDGAEGKILLLRPFNLDDSIEDRLINDVKGVFPTEEIIRVGDPNGLINGHEKVKSYYLTDDNWQEHVHRLAKEASCIVIAIDSPSGHKPQGYTSFDNITDNHVTGGVYWEVMEHLGYQDKIIYHIEHLPSFPFDDFKGEFIFDAFKAIKDNISADSMFVCVKNHDFFVATHASLIKSMLEVRDKSEADDLPRDVIHVTQYEDPDNPDLLKCLRLTLEPSGPGTAV